MGFAFHYRVNDLEVVGLERTASLSNLDYGVGKHGRLDFGCAPTELDFDTYAFGREVSLGYFNQFGGDDHAFKIFSLLKAAAFRNGQHPAHLAAALFGISQRCDAGNFEAAFDDPVDTGEAGIENAVIDVTRHLLRANQHALDLAVVDGGEVGAAVSVDVPASALEESNGCILQTAFGDAESEEHTSELQSLRHLVC